MQNLLKQSEEEFNAGEFVSIAPPDWNEDNVKGYNSFKKDFFDWHTSQMKLAYELGKKEGSKKKYYCEAGHDVDFDEKANDTRVCWECNK